MVVSGRPCFRVVSGQFCIVRKPAFLEGRRCYFPQNTNKKHADWSKKGENCGGVDSYERLGTAVRMSLEKLSAVPAGERVLMLFTDSSPTDEDLERVFCRNETPIRSAVLFVPTAYSGSEYMFRMVDADGKTDRAKTAVVFDIEDVIKERYLKKVTEKNGRQVMDDNQLLKNQLLMALA